MRGSERPNGALFESLVTLTVQVYAQLAQAAVRHLRLQRGLREIDLIVADGAGRVVAIEVKLAGTVDDRDVRHLHWLAERLGDDVLDLAVICTAPSAYRRPDGVAVIPLALPGP